MKHSLPLKNMTVEEKIIIMESLWDDLCKDQDQISSPDWHGSILKQREQQLKSGDDLFTDWQEAKENIQNSIK
ncbi:MAG: addiction module protein [Spirochaetales bacterium]|nr:addiction module protein [Spirochaetales bacterium]